MKFKFKQIIGMSVDITKYWHECRHCSRWHSTKIKWKKYDWIEKIEIENEVMENEIKNEIKVLKKYWHECQHCSRRNSTK